MASGDRGFDSGNRDSLLREFAQALRVPQEELVEGIDFYNHDFSAYGNEVYSRIETRVAHWMNYQEGGWFQHRLDDALDTAAAFDVVVDLGFSVPYAYTYPDLRDHPGPRFVLVDREPSAVDFYKLIVGLRGWQHAAKRDTVISADVESDVGRAEILNTIARYRPSSVLVIASEVVEHLTDDRQCWNLMRAIHNLPSVKKTRVYVTLPVGRQIPSHTHEFRTEAAALQYLAARMRVDRHRVLTPREAEKRTPFLEACVCAIGQMSAADESRHP